MAVARDPYAVIEFRRQYPRKVLGLGRAVFRHEDLVAPVGPLYVVRHRHHLCPSRRGPQPSCRMQEMADAPHNPATEMLH
jgi:hypothetical protein